jgi:amino acid adenylation domain-containing protein
MADCSRPIATSPELYREALLRRPVRPANPFVPFTRDAIEQSIPTRFEQQVCRYPQRLALKTKEGELTYEALNRAANRLAWTLLDQCAPGTEPIALLLEDDAWLIATILGVSKAGKIYVPLDPSIAPARLTAVLQDLQARLLVTNGRHLPLATTLVDPGCAVLNVEAISTSVPSENLNHSIAPDTPSAIIYTSGSTGLPKGVVQTHRHMLHNIMKHTNGFHLSADDRMTLMASWTTAQALTYIYSALLNGAALYVLDLKQAGLAPVADWLMRHEITIYCSIPTVFRHFLDTLTGAEQFPRLRLIHLGGEPLHTKDVERYRRHFSPDCILVNRLGITETGSISWYLIDRETPITSSLVPVGYLLDDTEILLLDDTGAAVGQHDVGEIAVKSRYLTLGYWRKPVLTQAAFLPDPLDASVRIYRTGDLGRILSDGCIEHLGRKDFQVKIRGQKIQVAEIEFALLDHAAIKEAVVTTWDDARGDARLVAYVVPTQPPGPTSRELRRFLHDRWPEYMLPAAFITLDALPLMPSGKIDRRALPAPTQTRSEAQADFIAPRTPVEQQLAAIWAQVLDVTPVGVHDNFLELGGHSLLAAQVLSRVRDAFHVEIPLDVFFAAPTVADCAVALLQQQAARGEADELNRILAEVEGPPEAEV